MKKYRYKINGKISFNRTSSNKLYLLIYSEVNTFKFNIPDKNINHDPQSTTRDVIKRHLHSKYFDLWIIPRDTEFTFYVTIYEKLCHHKRPEKMKSVLHDGVDFIFYRNTFNIDYIQ